MEVTAVDVVIKSHWDWMECVQLGRSRSDVVKVGWTGLGRRGERHLVSRWLNTSWSFRVAVGWPD